METVIKTSIRTKLKTVRDVLVGLVVVGVLIFTCKIPKTDIRFLWIIFASFLVLGWILIIVESILKLNDTVTLTDKTIKIHVHQSLFPQSVKPVDAEFQWEDIKAAHLEDLGEISNLRLKLTSGKVEEFVVGHLESRLKKEIESYLASKLKKKEKELYEDPVTQ